jgi:hypothetical protein
MIVGTLVIIFAIMLCAVVAMLGIDGACVADMGPRLPTYPNATITRQQHNFFRQFGMGESVTVLHSDDSVDVVRAWYSKTVGAIEYDDLQKGAIRHLGNTSWKVNEEDDGKGSQIILAGDCAG